MDNFISDVRIVTNLIKMEKQELIDTTKRILQEIETLDKQREAAMNHLLDIFPIKKDDKVRIMKDEEFVRFGFVNDIKVKLRGKEQKAAIEFDLQKCKKDGRKSNFSDYLAYGEYIKQME